MKTIERKNVPAVYQEMMKTESHHDHEIIKDGGGTMRWKEKRRVYQLLKSIPLNEMIELMYLMGLTKNSEAYRKLYRDMGYSLDGYWEIFYLDMNNADVKEYEQPKTK